MLRRRRVYADAAALDESKGAMVSADAVITGWHAAVGRAADVAANAAVRGIAFLVRTHVVALVWEGGGTDALAIP
jgi:hypothetical protein